MSFQIDTRYLNQIGHRLPLFTKKKQDLWQCRCPICGDSTKSSKKSHGYFYRHKNNLMFKCHRCSVCQHFGTFLKRLDPSLYQQYVFDRYSSGENGPTSHTKSDVSFLSFDESRFLYPTLDTVAQSLDTLSDDNEAVQYCLARQIPRTKFDQLYFIEHTRDIKQLAPQHESLESPEPRLVLPLYDQHNYLVGVSMRALRGESLRYLTIKFDVDSESPLIFGYQTLDVARTIQVVEGPIDSLFLDNAIACCGTSFGKLESLNLPEDMMVVIFDNQSRNKEVCKLVQRYVDRNCSVCIWPCGLHEKDINDMILAGFDPQQLIKENTYRGLMAQLKFTEWRNC